jgi:CheY-like chemotaxis protein
LIADDEEFCIASLQIMLQKAGIDTKQFVDFSLDGLECYEKVVQTYEEGQRYKLIITDFNMPKMGGLKSSKKIRSHFKKLKIPI